MRLNPLSIVLCVCMSAAGVLGQSRASSGAIDSYLRPYVDSGNFSGVVLVEKAGKIVFEKSYGFADREQHIRNTSATRFHIASMSMQFTAAAVLKLVDSGALSLE